MGHKTEMSFYYRRAFLVFCFDFDVLRGQEGDKAGENSEHSSKDVETLLVENILKYRDSV